MTAITFDTLKFVRTLRSANFDEAQAEAISSAFRDAQTEAKVATQADVEQLRTEMREMEHRIKLDMIKWMIGIAVAQTAILVGLISNLLPSLQ